MPCLARERALQKEVVDGLRRLIAKQAAGVVEDRQGWLLGISFYDNLLKLQLDSIPRCKRPRQAEH
jgi:hypothetical protein